MLTGLNTSESDSLLFWFCWMNCDEINLRHVCQCFHAGLVLLLPGLQSVSSGAAAELPEQPADAQRQVRRTHINTRLYKRYEEVICDRAVKPRLNLTDEMCALNLELGLGVFGLA